MKKRREGSLDSRGGSASTESDDMQLAVNERLVLSSLQAREDADSAEAAARDLRHSVDEYKRGEAERARLLSAAEDARREAEVANRIKDEFLATMSHELRTPLNAILGWASLLRSGTPDKEELDRALATIERNARAQARLIEDVLDVSRIMSGRLRLEIDDMDLVAVIEEAVEVIRPAAEAKHIELLVYVDCELTLRGDAGRLQQVVWNLLSNAVKFTPSHGTVEVVATCVECKIQIRVKDTGVGVAESQLGCIFERFRQVDGSTTRRAGGLGLGLAIVREIVQLHGGTVRAESGGLGKGTILSVALPVRAVATRAVAADDAPQAEAGPASSAVRRRGGRLDGLRILVADDELDSRQILGEALERAGAIVVTVDSARAAIEVLAQAEADLLISDIGMPGEDGYSLIRRVRSLPASRGGATPAIAVTAYAGRADRERSLAAGYHQHLAKPVDPDLLTEVAARIARR